MFQCLKTHTVTWHLSYVHVELLDGRLDAMDLLGEPAVHSSLCHCLSVQSLQSAGDSLQQGLVALSAHTNTRAAVKKDSLRWMQEENFQVKSPDYLSKCVSKLTSKNYKMVIQLQSEG